MSKLAEQLLVILTSYLGERMANAVMQAAAGKTGVDLGAFGAGDLPKVLDVLDGHLATYLRDENKRETCMRELRHAGPHLAPTPSIDALMIIALVREEDLLRARGLIRKLVRALRFPEDRQAQVAAGVVALATDLLKRGRQGTLVFRKLGSPSGLEVTAFERDKSAPESIQLASLRVNADRFVAESQPHAGTTIRATWFVTPTD